MLFSSGELHTHLLPQDSFEVIAEMSAESVLVDWVTNDDIRSLHIPESGGQQQCSEGAALPLPLALRCILYKQHTKIEENKL